MAFHYPFRMATLVETANLTAQNQITIPAPIRRALKLQPRSKVIFSLKNGRVVLANGTARRKGGDEPAWASFLRLLDEDIKRRPDRLAPVSAAFIKRARKLVRHVKVDLDAPLPD
jgi:antitoxin PrlF